MSSFLNASPGWPGKLKFKCVLWANSPVSERNMQDQSFVFSPETMKFAPQDLRNKLLTIKDVDGAYLRPVPNFYIDNFISFIKSNVVEKAPDPAKTGNKSKDKKEDKTFSWDGCIPLKSLDFLGIDKIISANLFIKDGQTVSTALADHQTWIADGSLYCKSNLLPSEYDSIEKIPFGFMKIIKSFCTKWSIGLETFAKSGETIGNQVYVPSTTGISYAGDPADVIAKNFLKPLFEKASNVYEGINPGMHWRLLKRTPVFQGEDFSIEFFTKAPSSMSVVSQDVKYRMQSDFSFLDIFSKESAKVCGAFGENGIFDEKQNQKIKDTLRKVLDFSGQIYYMIEIGVRHSTHNYWIVIAENSYPMFFHVGFFPVLSCTVQDNTSKTPVPSKSKQASDLPACQSGFSTTEGAQLTGEDTPPSLKEVSYVSFSDTKTIRKLSVYDGASSAELLKNEKLKVTVRQHGGSIVVTFSGHEDQPWVILRKDIDASSVPITNEGSKPIPVSESKVQYETVQMKIPFGQIAIMGGNRKCGFNFSPLIYNKVENYMMPQPFSVQGPVSVNDIDFMWRDKGVSLNPAVSVTLKDRQYTNEAGKYIEVVNDTKNKETTINRITYAKKVQPQVVLNYGKAPDMMMNKKAENKGIVESSLSLIASECVTDQGSTANSKLMEVSINVLPGGYLFPSIDGGDPWPLKDCVTPIVYYFRMHVLSSGLSFQKTPIDVSQHVLSFSEEWSETDWQKLEHSGSISFLVNDGMKFPNNQSNYLYKLVDKNFYLQISLWWEEGIMPTPSDPRDRVVFTGFCPGGIINTETNKKTLDCKIYDYSKILKDQFFLNSPFFDRMRDANAIRDILNLAGLRDGEDNDSTFEPGSLLRILADSDSKGGWYTFFFNGDKIYNREYALPGSYDMLQSPFLKFADGSAYWDAIERMSQLANKVAFFDRFGVFHFNPLPYDQEIWGGQSGSQTNWTIQDWAALSKVDFFATPKHLSPQNTDCAELNRQIIGDYKVERVVQDVMNEIKVISTSANGEIFVAGHTNYSSLNDPDTSGFLGYHKPFLQMDGIFGSADNVKWMVKNYTRMFIPPIKVSFRAIGRNDIKALDVITFQPLGSREKQPLVITSVKSEVDASKGTWFQDFECLWLFPRQDIQWGNTNEVGLGLDGSISGTP